MWWYGLGFPIWCKIARLGRANMNEKIYQNACMSSGEEAVEGHAEDILDTNGREFCIAIFFVVFGIISVIAGVGSNFYVQLMP